MNRPVGKEEAPMIVINLDIMMARRHITLKELSERVGITEANLSILKNNKAKAIRFSTLEALCRALACQPADLIAYTEGKADGN
jgi:putative transcriptional regulator